jgi:hypothetical protein
MCGNPVVKRNTWPKDNERTLYMYGNHRPVMPEGSIVHDTFHTTVIKEVQTGN